MSTRYYLRDIENQNTIDERLIENIFLSGSNSLNHSIMNRENFIQFEDSDYITFFNKENKEIKETIINSILNKKEEFFYLIKNKFTIIFFSDIGINKELFSKLEEEIYESLSNLRNNIEDIYSEINNTQRKNKENFLINLVTIQSLNNISFETLSSSYMNLNESGFYNYLQKISTEGTLEKAEKKISKVIEETKILFQKLDILRELFLQYDNSYKERTSIREEFEDFYENNLNLLRIYLFIKTAEILDTDILYS